MYYISIFDYTAKNTNWNFDDNSKTGGLHAMKYIPHLLIYFCCLLNTNSTAQEINMRLSSYPRKQLTDIFQKANEHIRTGHYDTAINQLKQLLYLNNITGSKNELLPSIYNHLGSAYIFKGEFDKAIKYLHSGITVCEASKDTNYVMLIRLYNNISIIYNRISDNQQALQYLDKAEAISRKHNYLEILAGILVNKGRVYKEMNQWERSKAEFQKAISFTDSLKNIDKVYGMTLLEFHQVALTNMGYLYLQQKQASLALSYFQQADRYSSQKDNPYNRIPTLLGVGKANLALKNYLLAEQYLTQALLMSKQSLVGDGVTEATENLSNLYADLKQFEKAYKYHLEYIKSDNSIRGEHKIKQIKDLETKYNVAEKDKLLAQNKLQIVQQQKDITQKNSWIWAVTIGSVALLLAGIMVYRNLKHRQRNQHNQIQLLQQEKEIDLLKALMQGEEKERKRIAHDLHDGIGGMLAAVKMNFAALKTRYNAQYNLAELDPLMHMLDDTADEVRKTAHNLMPSILLKHNLNEALSNYCDHINNTGILHIHFYTHQLPENLPKDFELMVYRTAQELIQNIIKHANASDAVLEMEYRDHKFHLTVEDNGKGFDTKLLKTNGFGLQNIQFKVQALKGTILIESAPEKGTTISISFKEDSVFESFIKQNA